MIIQETTELDHPVAEVFAYIADARNDPEWCASVRSCEQVEGDGPAVGARYLAVHKPGPKESELHLEVLEYDPPRRIAWRQVDGAGTFVVSFDLEPTDSGGTRLTQTDDTSWDGIFKLLAPVVHAAIRRTLPKQFAALQLHLEAQGSRRD